MKNNLAIALIIFFSLRLQAQDVHFSQITETPLLLNAGATGMFKGFCRASFNYRTQWGAAMNNPYQTMFASYDMPLLQNKKRLSHFGVGGYFYSDNAGDSRLKTTAGILSMSAIVKLNDLNSLSAGFQFGLLQKTASTTELQWPSQYNGYTYDPNLSANEPNAFNSFSFFDMAAGINYQFERTEDKNIFRITLGSSYFHFANPRQEFYNPSQNKLHEKIVLNGIIRYDIPDTRYGFAIPALYMMQGGSAEIILGGHVLYKISQGTKFTGFYSESSVSGGAIYRINDAIIPQVFFEVGYFGIGFSYDYSQVPGKSNAIEISLKYSNLKNALFRDK